MGSNGQLPFIEFCLLTDTAKQPRRQTPGAAGFDLAADEPFTIPPNGRVLVSTGVSMAIPPDHYGQILPRSSWASKGITVDGGVIDSDYRGEIKVILVNTTDSPYSVLWGDRIAQIVVLPILTPAVQVRSLDKTARGTGGFGSTGHA